jgi:hypothetical protein
MATLRTVGLIETAAHMFLGQDKDGYNIFKYNGESASPIGRGIIDVIREGHTTGMLRHAFGVADPTRELYLLFVAMDDQMFPEQCFVYNNQVSQWVATWQLPFAVSAAGIWTLGGVPSAVIVRSSDGMPMKLNYESKTDHRAPTGSGWSEVAIVQSVETGDLAPFGRKSQANSYDVWLSYLDEGLTQVALSVSHDGGASFHDAYYHQLGSPNADDARRVEKMNVDVDQGRRTRVKLVNDIIGQGFNFSEMVIDVSQEQEVP